MDDVFLKLVNLSISASWLILAVLVLRVVLKKAPKWVMPLLWGVVALRLVCLFSIESALSLIPSAETIPSEIVTETREPVLYEQATLDIVTNPTLPSAAEVPVGVSRQQAQVDFNIDKSYYMGLYFLYFNRHNIRKFVNILPVIFGR